MNAGKVAVGDGDFCTGQEAKEGFALPFELAFAEALGLAGCLPLGEAQGLSLGQLGSPIFARMLDLVHDLPVGVELALREGRFIGQLQRGSERARRQIGRYCREIEGMDEQL